MRKTQQLGQILVELGYVTQEQLVRAVMEQKDTGERLGAILVRRGHLTPEQLTEALALQAGVEYVRFTIADVQPEAIAELSPAIARRLQILPLRVENDRLVVAPMDIHHTESLQELYRMVAKPVSLVCANPAMVEAALRLYYPQDASDIDLASDYPYVREFVDSLLKDALQRGAEAVHLEPQDTHTVVVRYRVDGQMETVRRVPTAYGRAVVHRIKKLTGTPQSGSSTAFSGILRFEGDSASATVQISCLQTSRGERAVIRFLPDTASSAASTELCEHSANTLQRILSSRAGLLLVSGEDRASCQAILRTVLRGKLEEGAVAFCLDPVAGQGLSGVHHVAIEADSPASAEPLRAVLAQDPDVVVAGMVENTLPMQMLASAAGAGVWVAVAMRAVNVAGALNRLQVFGVAPVMVASALLGVVQVHVLPRLCAHCRTAEPATLPDWLADAPHEASVVYRAPGCERCRYTGYSGTVSVLEVFSPDADLRELLIQGAEPHEIDRLVRAHLQPALCATLRQKVLSGEVSLQHACILWEWQYPSGMQFVTLAA